MDILVSFDRMPGLSFFSLQREWSERIGRPVELCTIEAMHPVARARAEAVVVSDPLLLPRCGKRRRRSRPTRPG